MGSVGWVGWVGGVDGCIRHNLSTQMDRQNMKNSSSKPVNDTVIYLVRRRYSQNGRHSHIDA